MIELQWLDLMPENPWLSLAGTHDVNDPLVKDWKLEMAEYRREIEPGFPILAADL